MRLPPSPRIDCVSKLVLASLGVVCQKVLFACHWDVAASLHHPGHLWGHCQGILWQRPTAQWKCLCHIRLLLMKQCLQASLLQYYSWADQASAPWSGKRFGHGAKQNGGKTSANHIVMRLPPSARIDCVSKLVLASLSVVCQKVLFACHWDVTASPQHPGHLWGHCQSILLRRPTLRRVACGRCMHLVGWHI